MTVTDVKAVTKTRYRVYIDEQFAFVLYKSELSRYKITVGEEISDSVYLSIKKDVVLKRAKLRALHLLNDMGRTEMQLRQKLKQNDYTEDVIEETIRYVKAFGYVNDEEYARSFIMNRMDRKSKKELQMQLAGKGVSEQVAEKIFEECYDDESVQQAILSLMKKKRFHPDTAEYVEKQKMFAYLMRKGFCYDDIRQVIQVSEWNA